MVYVEKNIQKTKPSDFQKHRGSFPHDLGEMPSTLMREINKIRGDIIPPKTLSRPKTDPKRQWVKNLKFYKPSSLGLLPIVFLSPKICQKSYQNSGPCGQKPLFCLMPKLTAAPKSPKQNEQNEGAWGEGGLLEVVARFNELIIPSLHHPDV